MLECVDSPVFVFRIPLLIALACVDEHKVVNGVAKSKKKGISRKSRVQVTPCHGVRENLHCVSCDEDMLGRIGRARECKNRGRFSLFLRGSGLTVTRLGEGREVRAEKGKAK